MKCLSAKNGSQHMTMLKRHRLAKGLTLAEVGKRSGVTGAAVHTYETGQCLPRPKVIPKLARVLGLRPMELMQLLSPSLEPSAA